VRRLISRCGQGFILGLTFMYCGLCGRAKRVDIFSCPVECVSCAERWFSLCRDDFVRRHRLEHTLVPRSNPAIGPFAIRKGLPGAAGRVSTAEPAGRRHVLRDGDDFLNGRYSRGHTVSFDGGTVVPASASPHVVGKWAVEAAVDPEEMLVAALSTCPRHASPEAQDSL
jgi:hypothetical protein